MIPVAGNDTACFQAQSKICMELMNILNMWEAKSIQREMFSFVFFFSSLLMYLDLKKALMQIEGANCTPDHHQKERSMLFSSLSAQTKPQNKSALSYCKTKLVLFFQYNNAKTYKSPRPLRPLAAFTLIRTASATRVQSCVSFSPRKINSQ